MRRRIDELVARYSLEPDLLDIYVEGKFDSDCLSAYLDKRELHGAQVKAYPVVPGKRASSMLVGLAPSWRMPLADLRRRGFRRVGVAFLRGFCRPVMSQ